MEPVDKDQQGSSTERRSPNIDDSRAFNQEFSQRITKYDGVSDERVLNKFLDPHEETKHENENLSSNEYLLTTSGSWEVDAEIFEKCFGVQFLVPDPNATDILPNVVVSEQKTKPRLKAKPKAKLKRKPKAKRKNKEASSSGVSGCKMKKMSKGQFGNPTINIDPQVVSKESSLQT